MNSVLLSIKTDPQTKQDLKDFARELGMTSTALVNAVVRQTLRNRRVELSTELVPTPYLEKILLEAEEDLKHNRNITRTHSNEEALAHLDKLMAK